jgi:hypothetical protein
MERKILCIRNLLINFIKKRKRFFVDLPPFVRTRNNIGFVQPAASSQALNGNRSTNIKPFQGAQLCGALNQSDGTFPACRRGRVSVQPNMNAGLFIETDKPGNNTYRFLKRFRCTYNKAYSRIRERTRKRRTVWGRPHQGTDPTPCIDVVMHNE